MEKCEDHREHCNRITRNETDIKTIFDLVEKIRNRLPNWATVLIGLLMGVIGWLLSRIT